MPWSKTLCSAAFLRAVFVGASDWNIEIPAPRFRLGGGAGGIAHDGVWSVRMPIGDVQKMLHSTG
jgi:hypothetical protein